METQAKVDQCVHFISEIQGERGGEIHYSSLSAKLDAKTPAALTVGTTQCWDKDDWENQQKDTIQSVQSLKVSTKLSTDRWNFNVILYFWMVVSLTVCKTNKQTMCNE